MNTTICNAIRERLVLTLNYDWGYRSVEPHVYGINSKGNELIRAYQVGGQSKSGENVGWKLFRVDEIKSLSASGTKFSGPRIGYNRQDKAMDQQIYCAL
jgi:hypothetical protein